MTFTYAASREAAQKLANETGSTAVLTDSANRDAVIATVRETGLLDVLVINAGIVVFGDPWNMTQTTLTDCSGSMSTHRSTLLSKQHGRCPTAAGSS